MPPKKDESRQALPVVLDQAGLPAYIDSTRVIGTDRAKLNVTAVLPPPTPATPWQVQAQQIISIDEIDLVNSQLVGTPAPVGTIQDLFDRDLNTAVQFSGNLSDAIYIAFKSTIMIGRATLVSSPVGPNNVRTDIVIIAVSADGNFYVVYDGLMLPPGLAIGVDTGNFKSLPTLPLGSSPIPAVALLVFVTNDGPMWNLGEISIFKVIETKSYCYNELNEPLFVQDEQQICVDEVDLTRSALTGYLFTGAIKDIFNKMIGVGNLIYYPAPQESGLVDIEYKKPELISRVAMVGSFPAGTQVFLNRVGVGIELVYTLVDYNNVGLDTDNFKPIEAVGIRLVLPGYTIIDELAIHKTFEVKGQFTLQADSAHPAHVQAEQQIVRDEVIITSTGGVVNPEAIIDKDSGTYCTLPAANGGSSLQMVFTHPISVGRAGFYIGPTGLNNLTIRFYSGSTVFTITGANEVGDLLAWGDTGKIMLTGLEFIQPGGALDSSIYEIILEKVIQVAIETAPEEPLFVEDEQQLVSREFASITGTTGVVDPENIVDKTSAPAIIPVGGGSINGVLTHPILVGNVVIVGAINNSLTIDIVKEDGTLFNAIPSAGSGVVDGRTSGNFTPIWATQIIITDTDGDRIDEMVVQKVFDVKGFILQAISRSQITDLDWISELELAPGDQLTKGGLPVPETGVGQNTMINLIGQGVDIELDDSETIDGEIYIEEGPGALYGDLNVDIHWFYSPDNVNWYYFATSSIVETVNAKNPDGFMANGGPCYRQFSQPIHAYAKFVAVAIHNKSQNALANITVHTFSFIRQR